MQWALRNGDTIYQAINWSVGSSFELVHMFSQEQVMTSWEVTVVMHPGKKVNAIVKLKTQG